MLERTEGDYQRGTFRILQLEVEAGDGRAWLMPKHDPCGSSNEDTNTHQPPLAN